MHDGEHDIGYSSSIGVQGGEVGAAVVAENAVERVDGLACRASDHRLMEWRISVGDSGVDLDHRVAPVMRVDRPAGFTRPTEIISLAVGRGTMPWPEPGGERLDMDGVGQAGERGAERLFAHMPRLHAQEDAPGSHAADFRHAGQAEVRCLGDQCGEEGMFVGGRQARRDMTEVRDEPGPALDL